MGNLLQQATSSASNKQNVKQITADFLQGVTSEVCNSEFKIWQWKRELISG